MKKNNVKFKAIGNLSKIDILTRNRLKYAESSTSENNGLTLSLAISYGGRQEILHAINKIIDSKDTKITENSFSKFLYTSDIPDPDLLIRTGGEMRLSNFLLWDLAYTELMFVPQLWPDFNKLILENCISDYSKRIRKYGGDN